MFHDDIPFQLGIRNRAVGLVEMSPSPEIGTFGSFDEIAVFVPLRVYERDVPFVVFGFLVQEVEDTPDARESHSDHGDLLRGLVDGLRKLSGHAEERKYNTGGNRYEPGGDTTDTDIWSVDRQQQSADDGEKDVSEIADIAEDRP